MANGDQPMIDTLSQIDVEGTNVDWREAANDEDPDDEELPETPADVVKVLGFDPKKPD